MVPGFVWTIWWNLDWRRYLKFYGIKGPTYPVWVQLLFRTFFALCSLGAAVELGRRLLLNARPIQFYFHCLLVAGAWFAAIVLMVLAAESMMTKRGGKSDSASMSQDFKMQVQRDGFAVIPACLDETTLESLSTEFEDSHHSERNLLSIQSIQALATSSSIREIMETILGPECFAVRGIFFNKTRTSNWKVAWHQDLTIAVRERKNVEGFGPWSMKAGVLHVQPPCEVMAGMLAIRLHLDESACDNGPSRVIAGSHSAGRLSGERIRTWSKQEPVTCTVPRGGALVMRPLLLHASSASAITKSRRVIHLEFAGAELPQGLNWCDKVSAKEAHPRS